MTAETPGRIGPPPAAPARDPAREALEAARRWLGDGGRWIRGAAESREGGVRRACAIGAIDIAQGGAAGPRRTGAGRAAVRALALAFDPGAGCAPENHCGCGGGEDCAEAPADEGVCTACALGVVARGNDSAESFAEVAAAFARAIAARGKGGGQ